MTSDYCPICMKDTERIEQDGETLCKRCYNIFKIKKPTPERLKESYLNWFTRRII